MKLKAVAMGLIAGVFLVFSVHGVQAAPKKTAGQSQSSQPSSGAQSDQQSSGKGGAQGGMNGGSATIGSSNIKQIQQKLKQQGFDPGPVDGKLGPKTQDALRQFQQKQGIQPTGQIDQQTMAALGVTGSGQGSSQGGSMQGGSSSTPGGSMQGGGSSGGTQGGSSQSPGMGGGQSGSSGQSGGGQ